MAFAEKGATIYLVHQAEGWRIRINFDDGDTYTADQAYPSKREADEAFKAWARQIGLQPETAQ